MDTEVVNTLLTIGGSFVVVWLGALFVARQAANDLRSNIDSEIEILGKLDAESDEAKLLDSHIRKNIRELVDRDVRRQQNSQNRWRIGTVVFISAALIGTGYWRDVGVWAPVRIPVEVLFWFLWVMYVLVVSQGLWSAAKTAFYFGKIGVHLSKFAVQWSWLKGRTTWIKGKTVFYRAQLWRLRRKSAKQRQRLEEQRQRFEARRAYSAYVVQIFLENKDKIIEQSGQEAWDAMMARRAEIDALGDAIESDLRAIRNPDDDAREDEEHSGQAQRP